MVDPSTPLSVVRQSLSGFLPPDQQDIAYRFVALQSQASTLEDSIVQSETEKLIPVSGVLGNRGQLVCTNTKATRRPDLLGLATTRLVNRYLSVQVWLNYNDPEAVSANNAIHAVQPLLLSKVKPTVDRNVGSYENVCVCVEGSVIGFNLTCWGAAGFTYYIAPDAGEPVVNGDLNLCLWNTPNQFATTSIYRYAGKPQTIRIMGTSTLGISGDQILRYQKVKFTARNITSYWQDGNQFASNAQPPSLAAPAGFGDILGDVSDAFSGWGLDTPFSRMGLAANIGTVPGGAINPATIAPGPASQQQFGKPIYNVNIDQGDPLGEVLVYFFVFPDWDAANRALGAMNSPID